MAAIHRVWAAWIGPLFTHTIGKSEIYMSSVFWEDFLCPTISISKNNLNGEIWVPKSWGA